MSFDNPRHLAERFIVGLVLAVIFFAAVGVLYGVQWLLGYL